MNTHSVRHIRKLGGEQLEMRAAPATLLPLPLLEPLFSWQSDHDASELLALDYQKETGSSVKASSSSSPDLWAIYREEIAERALAALLAPEQADETNAPSSEQNFTSPLQQREAQIAFPSVLSAGMLVAEGKAVGSTAIEADSTGATRVELRWELIAEGETGSTNSPPEFLSFYGAEGVYTWTFYGKVTDDKMSGLTIQFGGVIPSGSVTPDANGEFEYVTMISSSGNAIATVVDAEGLTDTAEYYVHLTYRGTPGR